MAVTVDIKTSVLYFWEEGPNRKVWLGFHITVVWVLGNSFTIRSIRVSYLEEEMAKFHKLLGRKSKLRGVLKWINLYWCFKKTLKLFLFNNISKQTSDSRIFFYHVWCTTRLLEEVNTGAAQMPFYLVPQACSVLGLSYRVRGAAGGDVCWPGIISPLCLVAGPALEASLGQEERDHGPLGRLKDWGSPSLGYFRESS